MPFTFSSHLLYGETNSTPSPNVCDFALVSSLQVPHPHSAPYCPRMCHEKRRVKRMRFQQTFLWNKQLQRKMGCFCCHAKHYAFLKTVNKLEIFHGINMILTMMEALLMFQRWMLGRDL